MSQAASGSRRAGRRLGGSDPSTEARADQAPWTFLSNHAHVLLCVAADPSVRVRDVADRVGITERAAQRILADLASEGYLVRERVGRRNRYRLRLDRPMRHPIERVRSVRALVEALVEVSSSE